MEVDELLTSSIRYTWTYNKTQNETQFYAQNGHRLRTPPRQSKCPFRYRQNGVCAPSPPTDRAAADSHMVGAQVWL